ncbi:HRQ1 [Candida oxycetoniae]|uniref:HRQ1 n=1 Tax=Candida oxycetoniae TaxID=497107 RepID=A0AAI9WXY4_9ASCO|nr:HRQ1 [Candida oxycetoniae]KAI3404559.2 HRQ1 [Candida oxycetoniae]
MFSRKRLGAGLAVVAAAAAAVTAVAVAFAAAVTVTAVAVAVAFTVAAAAAAAAATVTVTAVAVAFAAAAVTAVAVAVAFTVAAAAAAAAATVTVTAVAVAFAAAAVTAVAVAVAFTVAAAAAAAAVTAVAVAAATATVTVTAVAVAAAATVTVAVAAAVAIAFTVAAAAADAIAFTVPFAAVAVAIFHEINTHLTFLSSHSRSVIPSYKLLQKFNKSITLTDLANIKHIFPKDEIFFDYVDENQIMVSFMEEVKVGKGGRFSQTAVADKFQDALRESKQILIFDFQDVKIHGIGKVMKGNKRLKLGKSNEFQTKRRQAFFLSNHENVLAPLQQTHLTKIIKGRDCIFQENLQIFIGKYQDQCQAEKELLQMTKPLIPKEPEFENIVEVLEAKKTSSVQPRPPTSVDDMIAALKNSKFYVDQIVSTLQLNYAQQAQYQQVSQMNSELLHPELRQALLASKGISFDDGLYTHQAQALDTLLDDSHDTHVILSTSTASGKSLVYQLPILNSILWDITNGNNKRCTTALFIFPTKALAQDQMRHFRMFLNHLPTHSKRPIVINAYDGDTPFAERQQISKTSDILFTNPDTIHASILPNNQYKVWMEFMSALKYVVMDELHVYKGTFGINVGYVMARLARIKHKYCPNGKRVRFVSCSATIANPNAHFRTICSLSDDDEVLHIANDGSAKCEKKLIVWNPPVLMNNVGEKARSESTSLMIPRVSSIKESAKLLLTLLTDLQGLRVLVFCPIRVVTEMMMREIRTQLQSSHFKASGLSQSDIMSYRGGYSKSDRRIIEKKMFDGQLRAIIATNALELGIDLSNLDVVITCGFPVSKSNLHQQFGRAGRGQAATGSLAVFVPMRSPIDQYYIEHPDELIQNNYEDLCVDSLRDMEHGSLLLERHLQCAAYEMAIDKEDDYRWFSKGRSRESFYKILDQHLVLDVDGKYRTNPRYLPRPTKLVTIRAIEDETVAVVDVTNNKNVVMEEIELSRTTFTIYEGGIFLHQGQPYLVKEFNHKEKYCKVERVNVDWTTSQRDYTDVDPEEVELVKPIMPVNMKEQLDTPAFFGQIKVTMKVFGFFKVNRKEEILEVVEVKNPPIIAYAKGCWLNVPKTAIDIIRDKNLSPSGGIHAAAHGIMNMLPLYINSTKTNVHALDFEMATECKAPSKEFKATETKRKRPPRLVFYDVKGNKNGSGYSYKTFECIDELVYTSFHRINDCKCQWGCPLCVVGATCREQMRVMSRPAALIVLASFLGMDLHKLADRLPDGPEPGMPTVLHNTISDVSSAVRFSPNVKILNIAKT